MDNEPSTDLPPPERPWSIWQWLLLFTPSLLMIVGAAKGIRPKGSVGVLVSLNYTVPIALLICLFLAMKLKGYTRKDNRFVKDKAS